MSRLIDANVILRKLLQDTEHPKYARCVEELKRGGIIKAYIFPEIVYAFVGNTRRMLACTYAHEHNQLDEFNCNPRAYIQRFTPPAGWKKQSYYKLASRLEGLLAEFPDVELEYRLIINKALDTMQETGFDCVDCLLIAESILHNHTPVSVDKDLTLIR